MFIDLLFKEVEEARKNMSSKCANQFAYSPTSFGLTPKTLDNGDTGNTMITKAVLLINKLIEPTNVEMISLEDIIKEKTCIDYGTKGISTSEEFVSRADEIANAEYKNAFDKLVLLSAKQMEEIWKNNISEESKQKIFAEFKELADQMVERLVSEDINFMAYLGYDVYDLPVEKQIDMLSYAKQKLQEMIYNLAKDFPAYLIYGEKASATTNPSLPRRQMATYVAPVLDFSEDLDSMTHFVITPDVVIYDPRSIECFRELLKRLAQQLDEYDKQLGLKHPSKFSFEYFASPISFKAVRLNKNGNFIDVSDTDNYIAVWTDNQSTLCITIPGQHKSKK